jgi:hypothetical protein
MAQSLRLVGGVDVMAAPGRPGLRPGTLDPAPVDDRELARRTRTNVMVVGSERGASDVVVSLWRYFDGPVIVRRDGERLRLAPTSEPVGTIVLHGVDTLTRQEQRALNHWLDAAAGRTRVISTAPPSLLSLVEEERFDSQLYYRLNTICLDLRPA